jgi:hypothetical protein
MADDILLPLGYHTPLALLREYGYHHNLQKTKASVYVGETSQEEIVDESDAMFVALLRAKAEHVEWVASTDGNGDDVMYLQISGGGKAEWEWRIAGSVEKRICNELGLTGEPVPVLRELVRIMNYEIGYSVLYTEWYDSECFHLSSV